VLFLQLSVGNEHGLISYHAYTMLKIVELDIEEQFPVQLVKIRNPHGKGGKEWTGPWMDGDPRWDAVSQDKKDQIGYKGFQLIFKDAVFYEGRDVCTKCGPLNYL